VQDGSSCQDVIGGNIDPRMKWLPKTLKTQREEHQY